VVAANQRDDIETLTRFATGRQHARLALLGVDDERDGAVVDEGDLHHCTETAGGDGAVQRGGCLLDELLVERDREVGLGGVVERRACAFLRAGEEGELADDEEAAADVGHGTVHLAGVVLEDAQTNEFLGEPLAVGLGVGGMDAEEHEQPGADGAGCFTSDGDGGGGDALDDGAHGWIANAERRNSE